MGGVSKGIFFSSVESIGSTWNLVRLVKCLATYSRPRWLVSQHSFRRLCFDFGWSTHKLNPRLASIPLSVQNTKQPHPRGGPHQAYYVSLFHWPDLLFPATCPTCNLKERDMLPSWAGILFVRSSTSFRAQLDKTKERRNWETKQIKIKKLN